MTLKNPVAGVEPYWTLLDISCRAGAGKKTEAEFVPAAFIPFTQHTGDGKGFHRKGDGVELSYYKLGVNTSARDPGELLSPYHTTGILCRPDGTGRCGGWADLLSHMFKLHGVTSARRYWLIRSIAEDMDDRFLVRNCQFNGAGTLVQAHLPYTHTGNKDCIKLAGVPGQGKTNPQFDFGDHVFVEHNGKFYDPSYGVGPVANQFDYEQIGIAGVGTYTGLGKFPFVDQDGTAQHIPAYCGPGFVIYKIDAAGDFAKLATDFGVSGPDLLNHAYDKNLKAKWPAPKDVQIGDSVIVPRDWLNNKKLPMLYGRFI